MITPVGLRIPGDLSFDGWERAGRQLSRIIDSTAWCLGDWLVYGKHKYADRYLQAIQMADLDYQTLRNYAWVARRFELGRRRDGLSFQHHAEVASLVPAEQDHWLDEAERHGWSRNQLRRHVRAGRRGLAPTAATSAAVLPRVSVPNDRFERWQAAADRSSTDFGEWIVAALDRAAAQALRAEAAASPHSSAA
ncbi:LmbU family transcriptional regulator [Micromonospora sp. WMMD1076]|uniref:LmbU family transcriptional regulator n=1 Tax=Micromonospora TaxID=1873 RepID=UPI00249A884A|nr:LmbU family transcriptional regulator [Micromonospora sp. WMMD1076]WFF05905.1 LmbU family transcriptional regulator [Micromonospora sp. WMMD1076]